MKFDRISAPLPERLVAAVGKLGLVFRHEAWKGGGARGLTPTQGQIIAVILAGGNRPMRLGAIAAALAVTAATASEAVAALVRKGLVEKLPAPDDARAVALRLTARGRKEAQRASHWTDAVLSAFDALAAEERAALLRALLKTIAALQQRGAIPVSRMCATCVHFRPFACPGNADAPHHCAFVDAPFGDRHLRLDCPDHAEAPEPLRTENHRRFLAPPP